MAERTRRFGTHPATLLGAAVFALLMAASGRTNDARAQVGADSKTPPLNLLLTREELRSVVRDYEATTGENLTQPIDEDDAEVVVRAKGVLAPMRDVTQEPWGGIAAPFWAIMHPTQAWRIFLPIPPKGELKEEGPIRAEDRQ